MASAPNCTSSHTIYLSHIFITFVILQFCNIPRLLSISAMMRKLRRHKQQKQLRLHDASVFATSVPLSDNTACAAFMSTPERAHQKPNITVAEISEITASEHENGRM